MARTKSTKLCATTPERPPGYSRNMTNPLYSPFFHRGWEYFWFIDEWSTEYCLDGLRLWEDGVESQHFPMVTTEQMDAYAAEDHEDFWGKGAQQAQQRQEQPADDQANSAGNGGGAGGGNAAATGEDGGGNGGANAADTVAPATGIGTAVDATATGTT